MTKVLPVLVLPDPIDQAWKSKKALEEPVKRVYRGEYAQRALMGGVPRPAPEDARFMCVCGCHPAQHDEWGCEQTCACAGYRPSEVLFEGLRWPVLADACHTCEGTGHARLFRCIHCKKYVRVMDPHVFRDNNSEQFWCQACPRPVLPKPAEPPSA